MLTFILFGMLSYAPTKLCTLSQFALDDKGGLQNSELGIAFEQGSTLVSPFGGSAAPSRNINNAFSRHRHAFPEHHKNLPKSARVLLE
jgi:hypothetical protein